jgi:hypothetical protein
MFINLQYTPLFIKKLLRVSAFISGHHLEALVVVVMRHLSACNGCVTDGVFYNTTQPMTHPLHAHK